MAIVNKRNTYLALIQIILSFLLMAAFVLLTLGNLVSIPTEGNEKNEDYIYEFYRDYSNLEKDALGDAVNLGSLKLWGEAIHTIIPAIDVLSKGDSLSDLSDSDVYEGEGFLLLTFLFKETFVSSTYESLAFLFLMLSLMLLPFYIGFYLLYALVYMLFHLHQERLIFMRVTHCLSRSLYGIFLLGVITFFCPISAAGPDLLYLLLVVLAIVLIWVSFMYIKERSLDRKRFLLYSNIFSLVTLSFSTLSLWFVHRSGLIQVLYDKMSALDGIEIFFDLFDGQLDSHLLLMFLMISFVICFLWVGFSCLYHTFTRCIGIFNEKEKKSHDRLFQYPACILAGLLAVIMLLNASKHYAIQFTPEAHTQYILALVFAGLALLCEILYSSIGHFVIHIDMVTRLEILSGYADNRLVMDEEALENALSTEDAPEDVAEGEIAPKDAVEGEVAPEETVEGEVTTEAAVEDEAATEASVGDEAAPEDAVEDEAATEAAVEDEAAPEDAVEGEIAPEDAVEDEAATEEAVEDEATSEDTVEDKATPEDEPDVEDAPEDEPVVEEIPNTEIPTEEAHE